MLEFTCNGLVRLSLGFHNPNHTAAALCALLPLCWGWRWHAWLGRAFAGVLFVLLLMTYSRTGLLVAGLEVAVWLLLVNRRAACMVSIPFWCRGLWVMVGLAVAGLSLWWLVPRLVLDDSILNRPRIWLAGLRLFAANPGGVGLGRSGMLASSFLLDDEITVRTLVGSHLTLLVECGWFVGWVWGAFIALALTGLRESPRVGLAFAGLVVSGCSSTVFDWAVLLDFAKQGGLGWTNWILSWGMFAFFIGCGTWLVWSRTPRAEAARVQHAPRSIVFALACSGALVLAARLVPPGNAPRVAGGCAVVGDGNGPLVLRDDTWDLRAARAFFPDGACYALDPVDCGSTPDPAGRDMWLFGAAAEFSSRFPSARITLVSPPEFHRPSDNVVRILLKRYAEVRVDARVESY